MEPACGSSPVVSNGRATIPADTRPESGRLRLAEQGRADAGGTRQRQNVNLPF